MVRFECPGNLSMEVLLKLIEGINFSGTAAGGIGVIRLEFGISEDVRQAIVTLWTEQHSSSLIKIAEKTSAVAETFSSNVVILS